MGKRVVVLGAGFGGLEATSLLSEEFGDDLDIVLIDKTAGFVFGFSKLDVMFGRTASDQVFHPYADIVKPGVRFVQAEITAIDAVAKRVETTAGAFDADFLVIALGADYDMARTHGLAELGHEFYSEAGAFALRDTLAAFEGGDELGNLRCFRHAKSQDYSPPVSNREETPADRLPPLAP